MATEDLATAHAAAPRRRFKRLAKTAGGVAAGLILLDLVATAVTVWLGAGMLKP